MVSIAIVSMAMASMSRPMVSIREYTRAKNEFAWPQVRPAALL